MVAKISLLVQIFTELTDRGGTDGKERDRARKLHMICMHEVSHCKNDTHATMGSNNCVGKHMLENFNSCTIFNLFFVMKHCGK